MQSPQSSCPTNQSGNNQNESESVAIVDNPCWGGMEATKQDLHYLLQLMTNGYFVPKNHHIVNNSVSENTRTTSESMSSNDAIVNNEIQIQMVHKLIKNNVILYNDKDFIVLNKPADLRMDGHHLATVHKFVTFLFPPPSLLNQIQISNQTNLIHAILKLSNHSDLKDNIIRSTHQLDYATSGVLLLAKSKRAAGIACKAFEERTTKKEYVALLLGHLQSDCDDDNENRTSMCNHHHRTNIQFPFLNHDQQLIFDKWKDGSMEKKSKKERLDKKGGRKKLYTFIGYMPTHSIFAKWKALRLKQRKRQKLDDNEHQQSKPIAIIDDDEDEYDSRLWNSSPSHTPIEEEKLLNASWKDVRSYADKSVQLFFEDIAKQINDAERIKQEYRIKVEKAKDDDDGKEDSSNLNKKLPPFFRVHGEEKNSFYVQVPLADSKGDFRVVADPNSLKDLMKENESNIWHQYVSDANQSHDELEFKAALTKCHILHTGTWQNKPVTKVKLLPHTGRR